MLVTVIKSFPFSVDGINQQFASAKPEPQEVPDSLVASLVADGYILLPEGHAPVAMTEHRRTSIIDRLVALGRAELERASDDDLLKALDYAEQRDAARGAPADEQPELFNGADPAAFDHDGDGNPGGSLKLDGLAAIADVDLTKAPADLFDVLYRNPTSGEQLADKGLTEEAADARAKALAEMDEPAADIQVVPHVVEAAEQNQGGAKSALPTIDLDTADEAALRAFLTVRDGKNPDLRFGVDRLRALAKAAPAAEGASE